MVLARSGLPAQKVASQFLSGDCTMRSLLALLLMTMLVASVTADDAAVTELAPGFVEITHASAALGRDATYYAYVPVDASEGEVFPTLFILHGAYGSYKDWYTNTRLRDLAQVHRMVLVLPDGGQFGWYLDSPLMPESQYESYIMKDLLPDVAARLPVHESARGMMGLSMGGHGAMILAARHPGVFQSASSLSGILKISNHGEKWEIERRLGPLSEFPERWKAHSVWDQAEAYKPANIRLLFDCGEDDTGTGAIGDNRLLHERLVELGIPHVWREHAGTHSWQYWSDHLNEHLVFHQSAHIDDTPGFTHWQRHWYERVRLFHDENARMALKPLERPVLVLLGPSTMEGLDASLFPGFTVVNRGIIADGVGVAPRGTWQRLEECVFDVRPDVVLYSDATNDIGDLSRNGSPSLESIAEQYGKNLATICARLPETSVVVLTCGPARGRYSIINDNIRAFNKLLPDMALRQGCIFVETHDVLTDAEGLLKEEYTSDGLHLNAAGTAAFVGRIQAGLRLAMME
jgi:S-formylglutathione hydrolase FrmB/lysophospholipase L1-like esterase